MLDDVHIGEWLPAPAQAERPMFAIGDIHGRLDLLTMLCRTIEKIIREEELERALVVLLGDYINRGPRGLQVLKRVFASAPIKNAEVVRLPGNHEQMMLAFLRATNNKEYLLKWESNGGGRVAAELGLSMWQAHADPFLLKGKLITMLGADVLEQIAAMPLYHREGSYLFVHAGIHPDIGLKMLDRDWKDLPASGLDEDKDPLWIRGPFVTSGGQHEGNVVVVHGHTPRDEPELLSNRVNLDTTAYLSGRLSALQVSGDQMRIIQTAGDRHERAGGWI